MRRWAAPRSRLSVGLLKRPSATSCPLQRSQRQPNWSIASPSFSPRRSFRSMPPENLLLRVFADPRLVFCLGVEGWEMLLAQARSTSLTARLSYRIEDAGGIAELPDCVRKQFAAAR